MTIKAEVILNQASVSAVSNAINERVKEFTQKEAKTMGILMAEEASRLVRAEYKRGSNTPTIPEGKNKAHPKSRAGTRRRNITHLENSFTYKVRKVAGGYEAVLTIKPGVDAAKVAALNYGTQKTYTIYPVRAKMLAFADGGGIGEAARKTHPKVAKKAVRTPKTNAKASGFLERARATVVQRRTRGV